MSACGPEPEPEVDQVAELVGLLLSEDTRVVDGALEGVVALSGDPSGVALLRDVAPPGRTGTTLLQVCTRAVDSPSRRAQSAVALVNLSGTTVPSVRVQIRLHVWQAGPDSVDCLGRTADAGVAAELVKENGASTALALAAAAAGSNPSEGFLAQRRLLQLCCNLTRSIKTIGVLFGDAAPTSAQIGEASKGVTEILDIITAQLLQHHTEPESDLSLGALLRLVTNITADVVDGQPYGSPPSPYHASYPRHPHPLQKGSRPFNNSCKIAPL
jgi:hypothetical protein